MQVVRLRSGSDFEEWRAAARALLMRGTQPDKVLWEEAGEGDLFAASPEPETRVTRRAVGTVPERFIGLAKVALHHDDPKRFALLYRLLFRLQKDKGLLALRSDPDVARLYMLVDNLRERTRREADAGNLPPAPVLSPPKAEEPAPRR